MTIIASATDDVIEVITRDKGQKGDTGTDGLDGAGFDTVRSSLLNSPLCRLFAPNKLAETLSGSVTWARSTTATYVDRYGTVKSAAIDEAREESEGWLIEGASTNLLLYSEQMDNAAWTKVSSGAASSPVVTANFGTAPDGNATADRVQFDLGGGSTSADVSQLQQLPTSSTTKDSCSVWLKCNTGSSAELELVSASGVSNVVTVTTTWQRFSVTGAVAGSLNFRMRLKGDSTTSTDTADLLIWGAQVEELSSPSSYIVTTSAATTRAADLVSIEVENNIISSVQGDWSLFLNFETKNSDTQILINHITADASNSRFTSQLNASGNTTLRDMSATDLTALTAITDIKTSADLAYVRSGGDSITYADATQSQSVSGISPTTDFDFANVFSFGKITTTTALSFYGHMRNFMIFGFALSADEITYLSGL